MADDYAFDLTVDTVPPRVVAHTPAGDLAGVISSVDVFLSEAVETSTFTADDITILIATGTHRTNTPAELQAMLGADIARRYRVVNHDSRDGASLAHIGTTTTGVETVPTGRSSAAIIATDALFGGFTGALIGGAVTLIDQGNNWQRDLMVGAGIGILAGAAFGIYDSTTQPKAVTRAVSDRNNAASDVSGVQLAAIAGRF